MIVMEEEMIVIAPRVGIVEVRVRDNGHKLHKLRSLLEPSRHGTVEMSLENGLETKASVSQPPP